jgi:hypothetical protein
MENKVVPWPAKVLASIGFILAGLSWLGGLWWFFLGGQVGSFLAKFLPEAGWVGGSLVASLGIVLIISGFIHLFIGRALWKGKRWSRTLILIISSLGFIASLGSVIGGDFYSLISLAIYGLIGGYFFRSQSIKEAFK